MLALLKFFDKLPSALREVGIAGVCDIAIIVAMILNNALVYRSQLVQRSFEVPVSFTLLPAPLGVADYQPTTVSVTLAGQRKDFGFVKASDVKLTFGLLDARPGPRTLPITVRDLSFPERLELEDIEPRQVRIQVVEKPATNGVAAPKP